MCSHNMLQLSHQQFFNNRLLQNRFTEAKWEKQFKTEVACTQCSVGDFSIHIQGQQSNFSTSPPTTQSILDAVVGHMHGYVKTTINPLPPVLYLDLCN